MTKLRFTTILFAAAVALNGFAFGKLGHATVAKIAENHLTEATKTQLNKYLDGKSIAEIASWQDAVRETPEYKHTGKWHSAAIDKDGNVRIFNPKKWGLTKGMESIYTPMLNNGWKQMTDSAVAVHIKLLVHMTGDMHCPSHSGFEAHTQKFEFSVNGNTQAFHKFWDSGIMGLAKEPGYEKYAQKLDTFSTTEIANVQRGKLNEWILENAAIMEPLYTILTPDAVFEGEAATKLITDMSGIENRQIQKAGYRLARVLNEIFDPAVTPQQLF